MIMVEDKICERAAKCPLYAGLLKSNEVLVRAFKNRYCTNGKVGRENCKRYQVAAIAGACPPDILPNSELSVSDIINKMKQSQ